MNDESIVVLLGLGVLVYFLFIKEKRVMKIGEKWEELGLEEETPLYPNPYV